MVGLDPADKKRVGKFSLGMRQRLGIAQSIMEDPSILILDEPMNGLDNIGVQDMRKLFLSLKDEGKTILIACHNKEDINLLCDEVYSMDHGTDLCPLWITVMPNAWFSTKQLLIEMERGIIISTPFSIVELMPISPLVNVEINDKSEPITYRHRVRI